MIKTIDYTVGRWVILVSTLAPVELDGSSNMAQTFGFRRCQQLSSPLLRASSKPNRRAICSSVGFSFSISSLSNMAKVFCKKIHIQTYLQLDLIGGDSLAYRDVCYMLTSSMVLPDLSRVPRTQVPPRRAAHKHLWDNAACQSCE